MRWFRIIIAIQIWTSASSDHAGDVTAFVQRNQRNLSGRRRSSKIAEVPNPNMDQTVENILSWIQTTYMAQSARKARQEVLSRNYLPAVGPRSSTTQQPRPFESRTTQYPESGGYDSSDNGYPVQDQPQPPFNLPDSGGNPGGGGTVNGDADSVVTDVGSLPGGRESQGEGPSTSSGGPVSSNENTDNSIDSTVHPPHIHDIRVDCSKESMTINLELDKPFDGVIYSKGHYSEPQCRYVAPNSGQTKYSFTVMLNSCGTQFVDMFEEGKQAYLENVLVIQNEPGIQEVWDTVRSVRCQWEGSINKALSVALSIGALQQEIVTFSGDTAQASLDIQVGRGPYAPSASGLVKIGETMTLVVTVDGDPNFNILVRECTATDGNPDSGNVVQLTDSDGCVSKPKFFGAFQNTRDANRNAIIAYAFFQAFKFPDVMELVIQCNVELCKGQCTPCDQPNQKTEPGRRRRSVPSNSTWLSEAYQLNKTLHIFLPEDIDSAPAPAPLENGARDESSRPLCLSTPALSALLSAPPAAILLILGLLRYLRHRTRHKI